MTDKWRESLSAMMDGAADELEIQRILRETEKNAELRQQWSRFHLVQSITKGEQVMPATDDFSRKLMSAIAQEPVHRVGVWQRMASSSAFKPVMSAALAASVATVVVVGGGVLRQPASSMQAPILAVGGAPMSAAATQPVVNYSQPASASLSSVSLSPDTDNYGLSSGYRAASEAFGTSNVMTHEQALRAQLRLQHYMLRHAEHATMGNSATGVLPYARVTRFEVQP